MKIELTASQLAALRDIIAREAAFLANIAGSMLPDYDGPARRRIAARAQMLCWVLERITPAPRRRRRKRRRFKSPDELRASGR